MIKMLRKDDMERIRKETEKKFGKGVTPPSAKLRYDIIRIPTGMLELDYALNEGFPAGRFCLIRGFGDFSKTLIALSAIKNAQKMNMNCVFVSCCGSFDFSLADTVGIDIEKLKIIYIDSCKEIPKIVLNTDIVFNTLVVVDEWFFNESNFQNMKHSDAVIRKMVGFGNYVFKKHGLPTFLIIKDEVVSEFGDVKCETSTMEGIYFATSTNVDVRESESGFDFYISKNKTGPSGMRGFIKTNKEQK
jgi:hypothetical protein